jgi:lipopolysaccharide export system permease protein
MNILSWYVAKDFLRYLFYCLLAMLALLIVANMFGNIESVFSGWRSFVLFLDDTGRSIPTLLESILPMAALLATVMTFSGFSRSSELLAMKSAGMGMTRLIVPVAIVLVPVAALAYLNQNYLFNALHPEGWRGSLISETHHWRSDGQKIYYFRVIDSRRKRIDRAFIFDWLGEPFRIKEIKAIKGGRRFHDIWRFRGIATRGQSDGVWKYERLRRLVVPVEDFPDVFKPYELDAHHMPFFDLYRVIRQPEIRSPDIVVYILEWYQKIAILFAPFVMVLVGAPLSQFHYRTARVAGEVVVTIFGGIVYWISNETFLILGKGGLVHPFLAAWGANLLFVLLAVVLLARSR